MSDATLEKILQEARALPPEELLKLREQVDKWLQAQPPEARINEMLLEAGLLTKIKPPISDLTPYLDRQPVEGTGRPLSEQIIEDRC
jgi:hypothetical protein